MAVYISAFLISLIMTYVLTPAVKKIALFFGAMDKPNDRRINKNPIPNIGGVAIYAGFFLALIFTFPMDSTFKGIVLGGTFILLLGLIDDLYEVPPIIKLAGQILAAIILIYYGIKIEFITNPFGGMFYLSYWGFPLTVLWIVGITNTVNLIDGLDGLAAGVSAIAAFTLFFVGLQEGQTTASILAIALAGSAIGFLKYNFHPAEIFMGDTGAMFFGFILAAVSASGALKSAAAVTLIVPFLALGVPIFDTLFAIIRRIYNGKPIGKADHGHIHHRLLALGWNHSQAVLLVYGVSIALGLIALIINGSEIYDAIILLGIVILVLFYGAWKLGIFTVELPAEGTALEKSKI